MGGLRFRYLYDGTKLSCESIGDGGTPQSGKYYRGSFVYLGAENASGDYEERLDYVTTDSGLLRFTPDSLAQKYPCELPYLSNADKHFINVMKSVFESKTKASIYYTVKRTYIQYNEFGALYDEEFFKF